VLMNTFTYTAVQDACRYLADRHGENDQLMTTLLFYSLLHLLVVFASRVL